LGEIAQLEKAIIFTISKDQKSIILDGAINTSAFEKFKALSESYPQVKTLEIINCEGSINDEVNLKLAKFVHENGFNIHLNDNGLIASGGTDLFLAGKKRSIGQNTKIGVHSWAGNKEKATDFPKGHKNHQPYIDYYKSIDMTTQDAEEFYYFTIQSAPPEGIHWMTKEEIEKYDILYP